MTLPLTTTTVTVEDIASGTDPYEVQTYSVVGSGVPAVISGPSGVDLRVGGDQQTITAVLLCETTAPITPSSRVTDDTTGRVYTVSWVNERYELGLGHFKAGLYEVTGAADG